MALKGQLTLQRFDPHLQLVGIGGLHVLQIGFQQLYSVAILMRSTFALVRTSDRLSFEA